ncbi:MAG: cytochrome c peroxidase [Candidatus Krumholzibacteriia bacterium]
MTPRRRAGGLVIALVGALAIVLGVAARSSFSSMTTEFDVRAMDRLSSLQLGLPPVPLPAGEDPNAELIALGRKLFFDRRLSVNGTVSCGMCHIPEQGFTSNELATPVGVGGRSVRRNAPTVLNAAYLDRLFHDGRESTLESQALVPLTAPEEMANPALDDVVERLQELPEYRSLFANACGTEPSAEAIGRAIAAWERTLLAADAPFDRWHFGGDRDALTTAQRRGFALFTGDAGCVRCHTIADDHALFSDGEFHDTGIGFRAVTAAAQAGSVRVQVAPGVLVTVARAVVESVGERRPADLGRFEVTADPDDRHRFRTPTLRNVALTAPYMHDGSLRTLEEVVRFYAAGGVPHSGLDSLIAPLDLDEGEIADLVAFLESLTGSQVAELIADARSGGIGNHGPATGADAPDIETAAGGP